MIDERFRRVEESYAYWRSLLATGQITPEQLERGLDEAILEHEAPPPGLA
jgi:hypothetical protein